MNKYLTPLLLRPDFARQPRLLPAAVLRADALVFPVADYSSWGDLPVSMQNNRIYFFRLLHLHVPSAKALAIIEFIWKATLFTSFIGLFTRVSMITAAISGLYIIAVPNNFGKAGHGEGVLIITTFILALSCAGDAWSIDSLRNAWRSRDPHRAKPTSGEYTWPVKMVWLLMSLIFLGAGITKLLLGIGLDHHRQSLDHDPPALLRRILRPADEAGRVDRAAQDAVQIIAGLDDPDRADISAGDVQSRRGWTLCPACFSAQVGIYLMMGVNFEQFMFVYLFWVPWDRDRRAG